jgi:diguanylate cyclase (GGDEF)-like protein
VSGALLLLAGMVLGALGGWIAARRLGAGRGDAPALQSDEPEVGGPDLPAGLTVDAPFDTLAFALVESCARRMSMPCALIMREKDGGPASIVALSSDMDRRLLGIDVPLDSPAGRAITEGVPVVGSDGEQVFRPAIRDRRRRPHGGVAVPLGVSTRVAGALVAFGEPLSPGEAVALLSDFARRFSPALLPAHQVWLARRTAETDELTGLPNRRALNSAIARQSATGRGERAALVALDIDHFKVINDTLGHAAGDAALRHLARILEGATRGEDLAARVGGEEFAVWLPGADLGLGVDVAERLRSQVEATPFRYSGQERTLTISCGVSAYPNPIRHPANLMSTADAALYQAKREGRNRVVTAGVGGPG